MEKVKNFQRNYLESEKFFSKFSYSYFLGEGKISKTLKVMGNYLESEKFFSEKIFH
jgi:hypothetical protein